jgi:hypothetical protein
VALHSQRQAAADELAQEDIIGKIPRHEGGGRELAFLDQADERVAHVATRECKGERAHRTRDIHSAKRLGVQQVTRSCPVQRHQRFELLRVDSGRHER